VALRRALAAELAALTGGDTGYERFEVFVGPPGVGKTTTIAKIAAQERAIGGRTLGLVAADAFRAGAIEQLRSYAAVLGAPFRIARTAGELDQAIGASRHASLVDTAGRSAADGHLSELLAVLQRTRGVRTHLVIAADTSAATARRIFDRYGPMQPSRVVITKLDESESIAPLLGVVRERALPVSYLGTGQRVPEDLWRATPAGLAAALLREPVMEDVTCH
jgi:flagellar biosynthesis protein FlhF